MVTPRGPSFIWTLTGELSKTIDNSWHAHLSAPSFAFLAKSGFFCLRGDSRPRLFSGPEVSGPLARRCLRNEWSGRPGSNRRHPAWEAGVLPLNYSRSGTAICQGRTKLAYHRQGVVTTGTQPFRVHTFGLLFLRAYRDRTHSLFGFSNARQVVVDSASVRD